MFQESAQYAGVEFDENEKITIDEARNILTSNENNPNIYCQENKAKVNIKKEDFENPTKDITLPNLNNKDLELLGKTNKPVILKKNIIEKNKKHHPEIDLEEFKNIINNGLYNAERILQIEPNKKPNYYNFISERNGKNDNIVIELAENKENFEIVGCYKISNKGLKTKINTTTKNGGQSVITERYFLKGQQSNSALQGNSDTNIITDNSDNFNPENDNFARPKTLEEIHEDVRQRANGREYLGYFTQYHLYKINSHKFKNVFKFMTVHFRLFYFKLID